MRAITTQQLIVLVSANRIWIFAINVGQKDVDRGARNSFIDVDANGNWNVC